MASGLSTVEIQEWTEQVKGLYDQYDSILRNSVSTYTGVVGNIFNFPTVGGGTAQTNKAADADLTLAGVTLANVPATMSTTHATDRIDDLEQKKINFDVRTKYLRELTRIVNKSIDSRIITSLHTTTNTLTLPTVKTMDAPGVAAITKAMNVAKVPMDGERVLVIPPAALANMQNDAKLANRDYMGTAATQLLLQQGFVDNVSGFRILVMQDYGLLPTGTGTHFGYAFHKQAVGLAIAADLEAKISYIDHKDAWQVMVKTMAAAALVDGTGVFKFEITD